MASLSSFEILSRLSKDILKLGTVVDVGANCGQFAYAVVKFFPNVSIYSFEPVPDTYERLAVNTRFFREIKTFNFGLGSESGKIDFYQNEHSHASSALPISDFQKTELPETSKTKLITVPIKRLDDVIPTVGALTGPILLKLDVQGYEKNVLLGATSFLKEIDFLLFEASFVAMYEGEPLFDEMHAFVSDLGFKLVGPVGSLETNESRIVQLDLLYRRR